MVRPSIGFRKRIFVLTVRDAFGIARYKIRSRFTKHNFFLTHTQVYPLLTNAKTATNLQKMTQET